MCQLEERYQYNWITILPFLDAAYACGAESFKLSDTGLQKLQSSATFTENKESSIVGILSLATSVSLAYVLFALKVETTRSNNAQLLIKQGLLDYITMLHWGLDGEWLLQCQWIQEEVCKAKKLPLPRLSSISKGKLARTSKDHSGQITDR